MVIVQESAPSTSAAAVLLDSSPLLSMIDAGGTSTVAVVTTCIGTIVISRSAACSKYAKRMRVGIGKNFSAIGIRNDLYCYVYSASDS
mmetsp:Transcript_2417/g.4506  ORF Transcript_2417/g.4506 Transcript_2417/m.4506 type:complete len:88 (+) Transcript_2417:981-1244(+)